MDANHCIAGSTTTRPSRSELARMYWRAVRHVRRGRPHDLHTAELVAYLEHQFRAVWARFPK